MQYPRNIANSLERTAKKSPALLLDGARQTGKSTLIKQLGTNLFAAEYVSLDDLEIQLGAHGSPSDFIRDLPEHVVIDEIQRAPELFLSIKQSIDENRVPGRFLMSGSANVLMLPKLSESLVGRMIIKTLWPLSQGEIRKRQEDFISAAFASKLTSCESSVTWKQLVEMVCRGGYPEVVLANDLRYESDWFESYVKTLIQRDVRELMNIDSINSFPQLLTVLSQRSSMPVNVTDVGRICGIPRTSLLRYISLLESLFVIRFIPAWFVNREKRLIKSPKLLFVDSGLLSYLSKRGRSLLIDDRSAAGQIIENFVGTELLKQIGWSDSIVSLHHFRTQDGHEVDYVLEDDRGRLVGVEVKCSTSVSTSDMSGLKALQAVAAKKFVRGIILYSGNKTIRLSPEITAMPIAALWELNWRKAYNVFRNS